MLQVSASARKPQSRLKSMQKSGSKTAAASEEDGVSSLAGLMATKLQLAADEDDDPEEQHDSAAAANGAGDAASKVLQGTAVGVCKPGHSKRASSAAAGGRRVRFAEEAEQGSGQHSAADCSSSCTADVDVYEHLVVPQSLARHAVRRSRLAGLSSSVKAAALHETGSSSSSSTARKAVRIAATCSSDSDGDVAELDAGVATSSMRHAAAKLRSSASRSTAASAAASGPAQLQQQQQQGAWVPSVLLLLDGQVQQLPWESCEGLRQQNVYRYTTALCLLLHYDCRCACFFATALLIPLMRASVLSMYSVLLLQRPQSNLRHTDIAHLLLCSQVPQPYSGCSSCHQIHGISSSSARQQC
jgi:hypothetical protein